MDQWLWPWNKSPFFLMKVAWVSTSEKRAAKSDQPQGHVDGFFNHEGVIHHKYPPAGQTKTKAYYIESLRRLTNAVGKNGSSLFTIYSRYLCVMFYFQSVPTVPVSEANLSVLVITLHTTLSTRWFHLQVCGHFAQMQHINVVCKTGVK